MSSIIARRVARVSSAPGAPTDPDPSLLVPGASGAFNDSISGPRALAFTPDGKLALLANAGSEDVMVFDAQSGNEKQLVRPVPATFIEGIAVDHAGARAYVDGRSSHNVVVLALQSPDSATVAAVDGDPIDRLTGAFHTDSGAGNPTLDLNGPIVLDDVGTCVTSGPFPDQPKADDVVGKMHTACDFDTPTLRGIFATPPYLHDGSAATLADVVDRLRFSANLSAPEKADLVAFLQTL
jgi:processive rubber oxygenase RoxA-like protein